MGEENGPLDRMWTCNQCRKKHRTSFLARNEWKCPCENAPRPPDLFNYDKEEELE